MVLVLRALKERRRERKERALVFFSRRRRFASNTHRARARSQAPLLPNENSFSSSVCSPKDGRFFIPFLLVDQNREKKVVDEDFFSLFTNGFTHSFFLPHPFLNAVQLRCTNDARPGMGERFLLQERRSGSRAEMASVDGPSVDWPRRHDVALEKSRDEATDARPRLVVGIRVTGHGHAKRCVQAGTVGRERRVLRWYGFVDC